MIGSDGISRRERNSRFRIETPEEPEIPDVVAHVWDYFHELSNRRQSGPEALTHSEVQSWSTLTGTPVSNDEVSMLLAMDDAYLRAVSNEKSNPIKQATPSPTGIQGR